MQKIRLFLVLLLFQLSAFAQERPTPPSRFITRFDFHQFTGGLIVLQARVGNFPDTLNFILDTGSGGISLDSTTTTILGIEPTPSERIIRGIAGTRTVSFVYNQKLHLPGLSVDSLNFHVANYSLLSAVYGERIDGIIGYSLLSRYILKINYDSSFIEVWTKGAIKYPKGGHLLHPQINTLPVQPLEVRDQRTLKTRFLYDLGAGLNLMLTTSLVRDSNFLNKKRKLFPKQGEGLGGKIDMHVTVIKGVKLGPYRFRNVPTHIFDDVYNVTSYPYLGGIIGSDLLRRFNLILNYEKRQIHLLPNKHLREPFDYSYTGLELYAIGGEIVIGDVAQGSPAEKAGLQEGDVVIAINKNLEQDLQKMKNMLQAAGSRVAIIVLRNGSLKEFSFKVTSIL